MDFLDPRKRRAHRRRLITGYVLMATAIILGAYLLAASAGGYGYDIKTGDIVQNGLLFLDSKPGGTEIYINGQDHHSATSARMILPAGNYTIDLKRAGYRDWKRSFTLTEHSISRYVYPFLFPVKPTPAAIKSYPSAPPLATQSPDRHWLLIQTGASTDGVDFDELDTTTVKPAAQPILTPVVLPAGAFSVPFGTGSQLKMVEWSTDNKNVLLQHVYPGGNEFIVFNRTSPADSFSVNKTFSNNPSEVALHNKKADQLYLFNQAAGTLDLGNVGAATLEPVLTNVLAFKPNGSSLILYVTDQGAPSGQVAARIWNNGRTYPLYSFVKGEHYLIDMAQFQSDWYYAAGSSGSARINLYKNPLDTLTNTAIAKALPLISLRVSGADKLSFSANTRFVEAEGGQAFAVYDFETQTSYNYTLKNPLDGDLQWMDGHRLIGSSGGQVFVTDYDSTNQQTLVPTASNEEIFFDDSYNHLFSVAPDASGGYSLFSTDMRAGADLPKQ